ncbi:hypothetical protein BH18ACI5_BH18ACI5_27590 [soil metagenome]
MGVPLRANREEASSHKDHRRKIRKQHWDNLYIGRFIDALGSKCAKRCSGWKTLENGLLKRHAGMCVH